MHAKLPLCVALTCLALVPGCFSVDDSPLTPAEGSTTGGGSSSGALPDEDTTGSPAPTTDPSTSGETGEGSTSDAEGSTSTGEDEDESSTGNGEEATGDPAAPAVVEVLPADGAIGVEATQPLVLRFNTAMDKAATQAAYQSSDIPAGAVTFQWNPAGDELTITPNDPLAYAEGTSASTDALEYSFSLTSAAESEDGVALEEDLTVSFSTLRRLALTLEREGDLSGQVRDLAGATSGLSSFNIGDSTNNDPARAFVTFDVSTLPDVAAVEDASLHGEFSNVVGNPFSGLGAVLIYPVAFDTFDDPLFDTPTLGSPTGLFGTANDNDVDRDVTDMAATAIADPDAYGQRVQFCLRWAPTETDGDGQTDAVTFRAYETRLDLRILAP